MKKYLHQLATIEEVLYVLYYMRYDIDIDTLTRDEEFTLYDCDKAVNVLLDTIYYYCK